MPLFLDFVFLFGKRLTPQESHYSAFRYTSQLATGQELPVFRLCYNLRSVEKTTLHTGIPWTIRQVAVYHTFDMRSGKTLWIVVKGNKLVQNRMNEESAKEAQSGHFAESLMMHLLVCEWSGENWRWYINELESQAERVVPLEPDDQSGSVLPVARTGTLLVTGQPSTHTGSPRDAHLAVGKLVIGIKAKLRDVAYFVWSSWNNRVQRLKSSTDEEKVLSSAKLKPRARPKELPPTVSSRRGSRLSFKDIQNIHGLEEHVQEAVLVLKLNTQVLSDLREHYRHALSKADMGIINGYKHDLHRFYRVIRDVEKDVQLSQSQLESLLQLLANRKNLVSDTGEKLLSECGTDPKSDLCSLFGGYPIKL
jgi:hypothetical protein